MSNNKSFLFFRWKSGKDFFIVLSFHLKIRKDKKDGKAIISQYYYIQYSAVAEHGTLSEWYVSVGSVGGVPGIKRQSVTIVYPDRTYHLGVSDMHFGVSAGFRFAVW